MNRNKVHNFLQELLIFLEEIYGSLSKTQGQYTSLFDELLEHRIYFPISPGGKGCPENPEFVMCHCGGWRKADRIYPEPNHLVENKDLNITDSFSSLSSEVSNSITRNLGPQRKINDRTASNQIREGDSMEQIIDSLDQKIIEIRKKNLEFNYLLLPYVEKLEQFIQTSETNRRASSNASDREQPPVSENEGSKRSSNVSSSGKILLSRGVQHDNVGLDERFQPTREMLRLLNTKQDKYQHFGPIVMCDEQGNWKFRPAENQSEGYPQRCMKLFKGDSSCFLVGQPLLWPSVLGGWLGQVQMHHDPHMNTVQVKTVVWDIKYNREILKSYQIRFLLNVWVKDIKGKLKFIGEAIFIANKLTGFIKGEIPLKQVNENETCVDPDEISIRFWMAPLATPRRRASYDTLSFRSTSSRRSSTKSEDI